MSRLAEWVAGGVAGCPGTVDIAAPDDPPTPTPAPQGRAVSAADPSTRQRRRRGRWVTAAAVVLVVYGAMGIVYAPLLAPAQWRFLGAGISALTILGVLNTVTGIGLLRLAGWARLAAGLLSIFGLLFMHAPAVVAAVANGVWSGIDWLGIVGSLFVLFAVLRRWPAEPVEAD